MNLLVTGESKTFDLKGLREEEILQKILDEIPGAQSAPRPLQRSLYSHL